MPKDNNHKENNEIRLFLILYKTIINYKKPIIINSIFITFFYLIYLFISNSFSSVYKVRQGYIISKRFSQFEIPSDTTKNNFICLINDTESVYSYAKSNQFLNSFVKQIEVKYPTETDDLKNNITFSSLKDNSFSIDIINADKQFARSIINDYSLFLNRSLINQIKQCNLVNYNNQIFHYKVLNDYSKNIINNIQSELLYSIDLPNFKENHTYFVDTPFNQNSILYTNSKNPYLKESAIIYIFFLIGPCIYILYHLIIKQIILDEEGLKNLLSYKFLGTLDKKDNTYNRFLIEKNIASLKTLGKEKNLGIIFIWGDSKKPFKKLFQINNKDAKFMEVDYRDAEIINNLDNLILVVQSFKTRRSDINKSRIYLDKFSEKVIGYFIY